MRTEDVDALEAGYRSAKAALADVTYASGYPVYPQTISAFMQSLCAPPWGRRDYDPRRTMALLKRIEDVGEIDLCHLLTALGRAERFSDGIWISYLEDDRFDRIVARARVLLA
ncbi:MAG: hypothetical protein KDJ14_11335 [Xanthomonadales bacterium]|nr:hypothetical protein [Xanthomonadales bacterium]